MSGAEQLWQGVADRYAEDVCIPHSLIPAGKFCLDSWYYRRKEDLGKQL